MKHKSPFLIEGRLYCQVLDAAWYTWRDDRLIRDSKDAVIPGLLIYLGREHSMLCFLNNTQRIYSPSYHDTSYYFEEK